MENIEITKIGIEDILALQKLGRQTFFETYAAGNTEENMRDYLENDFALEKLQSELEEPNTSFYFANLNGENIGYLKLNFDAAQTELKAQNALEIERIYVLEDHQGKKIGQKLYEKALQIATQTKVAYIWLGVWEHNPKAMGFYQKNGFKVFDKHIFKLGDDLQTDFMMKKSMDVLDIQAILETDNILLLPLLETDFEQLYAVASDPNVWAQHPNKNRWQRDIFEVYFEGAILSKGAYKIIDKASGQIIGGTRFYDYKPSENRISIGYTFYGCAYWGKGINPTVKHLMLDYAFRFVDTVGFDVGAENVRSQIAVGRLGAEKTGEQTVAYYGEAPKPNFTYDLRREKWEDTKSKNN